jgi:haloacetate dehalogenase
LLVTRDLVPDTPITDPPIELPAVVNRHDRKMMNHFATAEINTGKTTIFVRSHGSGPPLLLLHGFPETHLMWRDIAPLLAREFTVVCADLCGYGQSGCPESTADHAPYAKRAMAQDMLAVMDQLGFSRFSVVGHDRGGRIAYRMALDHPHRVDSLAVLDIVPTATAWEQADDRFALGFWPWSLLAQPEPLPEHILTTAAEAIIDSALSKWGSASDVFPPTIRAAYVQSLRDPRHAHAICEEYRAASTIDRQHDHADRLAGRRIVSPLLVLWSAQGPLGTWYREEGGPLALWQHWGDDVQGHPIEGGHFFPEELPEQTAESLRRFFGAVARSLSSTDQSKAS